VVVVPGIIETPPVEELLIVLVKITVSHAQTVPIVTGLVAVLLGAADQLLTRLPAVLLGLPLDLDAAVKIYSRH